MYKFRLIFFLILFNSFNIYSQNNSDNLRLVRWLILSDNIVEGTIVKINDSTFELKVDKNLKGELKNDTIIVSKEKICKKYSDYQLNTKAVWLLFKNGFQYYLKGRGKSIFYNADNGYFYSPVYGKCSLKDLSDVAKNASKLYKLDNITNKIIKNTDDETINAFAAKSSFHKYFVKYANQIISINK